MPKLSEVIEHEPVTVEPHEPLSRAAQRMYDHRIGSVVVVEDGGTLQGIFTERDLMRASAAGVDTHRATVGRWMTSDPIVANAEDEVGAALQVMIDNGFRHLPVIGEGGLVGVVSMRTLTTAMQRTRMG